jgi:hypothetical protein
MAEAEIMHLTLKSALATSATHLNNVNAANSPLGQTDICVSARLFAAVPLLNLIDSISVSWGKFLN